MSSSDSDSSAASSPRVKSEVKKESSTSASSSVATPSKPSTALPPVRLPASAAQYAPMGTGVRLGKDGKTPLTKQQLNQILAREKREREAKERQRLGLPPALTKKQQKEAKRNQEKNALKGQAAAAADVAAKKIASGGGAENKKRKAPESDSDSDDSDDDQEEKKSSSSSSNKIAKTTTNPTPSAVAVKKEVKKEDSSDDDDDDSDSSDSSDDDDAEMKDDSSKPTAASASSNTDAKSTAKAAKAAAKAAETEAKRAARALKKEKNRSKLESQGKHPTQTDMQLMNRDLQATKLWEMYLKDRKERGAEITPLEADAGQLIGHHIASLPQYERPESHSWKLLDKHLKRIYGAKFEEQVCGGTIQPALRTKAERFDEKKDRARRKSQGGEDAEEVEEEEEDDIKQKQQHMDDPNIGAPYIVFITGSALRAVEIGRAFKKIQMQTRIVKLFAKHLKVEEQREELSHDVRVCIGTPNRLLKLSQNGYLKWNRTRLIIFDIGKTKKLLVAEAQEQRRVRNKIKNWRKEGKIAEADALEELIAQEGVQVKEEVRGKDRKMFTLLTLKDTKSEVWKLYEQYLQDVVVKKQSAKFVLY